MLFIILYLVLDLTLNHESQRLRFLLLRPFIRIKEFKLSFLITKKNYYLNHKILQHTFHPVANDEYAHYGTVAAPNKV